MWEDLRPLLAELFAVILKSLMFLWTVIKWLVEWIVTVAIWLYEIVILYCQLVYGLFTGHLYALAAMLIVLVVGYLVVNVLQKKKSFVHIPWYKEPRNQAFILIPIVTSFIAIATNPTMSDISGGGRFFFELFRNSPVLGPAGHLGVPTTIWALIISFVFVVVAGAIAVKKTERRKKKRPVVVDRRTEDEVETEAEEPLEEPRGNGQEAVILNQQPGWYEERRKQKDLEESE